ncbi:MAG: hypothetical protein JXB19_08350 [Bacteroidales bacterium]|nr:hypothetical protein [Bacteroidales bacterium]
MKTNPLLALLMTVACFTTNAQKPIEVFEDNVAFADADHPGITVTIPEVGYETVEKNWIRTIESGTKSKAVYENGAWSIFGANIKSISPTPVNIYSRLVGQDTLVKLLVSIELKKDFYAERGLAESEYTSAKNFIRQFAKDQYVNFAKDQLEAEENKLRDIENELKGFQKQESKLEKAIRKSESTIKNENDNLVVLNNELSTLTEEIISQNEQVVLLEEGAAKEERLKYIRDLEKRKTKVTKNINKAKNKISKAENAIRDANSRIPKEESLQNTTKERIAAQESVVAQFRAKVKAIEAY